MNIRSEIAHKYYINLQHRDDRRLEFEKQLRSIDIGQVTRFPAVNGRWLKSPRGYPNLAHRGIALSQRLLLRRAQLTGAESVMLLEDDVVFDTEIVEKLASIVLPDDWGIFYLGCAHVLPPIQWGQNLVKVRRAYDTHALIIRRKYFREVIYALKSKALAEPGEVLPNDVQLASLHGSIPTYACFPNLAWQSKSRSNLRIGASGNYDRFGNQTWKSENVAELNKAAAPAAPSLPATTFTSEPSTIDSVQKSTLGGIPKILHQMWATERLPKKFKEWSDSWDEVNSKSGWVKILWTDETLERFIKLNFPQFLSTWMDYDKPIKRADAARPLLLKQYGGVYADLDTACLRPLDDFLKMNDCVLGNQEYTDSPLEKEETVCNAIMASRKNHPFWNGIEDAMRVSAKLPVLDATGPRFLTRWTRKYFAETGNHPEVQIRPLRTIFGIHWNDPAKLVIRTASPATLRQLFPESLAVHFCTTTWL